jgi:hypothetical protein
MVERLAGDSEAETEGVASLEKADSQKAKCSIAARPLATAIAVMPADRSIVSSIRFGIYLKVR